MTDLGPLDCLGAIEGGRTYDDLVPLSVEAEMDGHLLVLGLPTLSPARRSRKPTEVGRPLELPQRRRESGELVPAAPSRGEGQREGREANAARV